MLASATEAMFNPFGDWLGMIYRRTERTTRRLAARRESILASAETMLRTGGLAALHVSAVARGAGVAVGTLYDYYGTKADLLRAITRRITERESDAMPDDVAQAVTHIARRMEKDRPLFFALTAEAAPSEIDEARHGYRAAVVTALVQRLPRNRDAELVAAAIYGMLVETVLRQSASADAAARIAVRALAVTA